MALKESRQELAREEADAPYAARKIWLPCTETAGGSAKFFAELLGNFLFSSLPYALSKYRSKSMAAEIARLCQDEHFDLVINGTATSLSQNTPPIDAETFDDCMLAYDLVYTSQPTPFMQLASRGGARKVSDGLGMLIEQAAESFHLWRGVRPDTVPIFKELRRLLSAEHATESAPAR